ncbi:hypothetical protein ACFYO1_02860 [Nocardia sp. NPDC006044]|uniref:hypothetical protein n=1 Tax=Nocardia sp. NPDC006044 TaxID=3364306 RepID=UPI0036AC2569
MLKQLQNVTDDIRRMTGATGWDRAVLRDLHVTADLLDELVHEIGIPERWITHVRALGNAGTRWTASQQLPAGRAEGREQQLARLHAQVDQLFEMTALQTVYRGRRGVIEPVLAERFDALQRLQWVRVAMVARALNVTRAEVGTRWSSDPRRWTALLEKSREVRPAELSKRWKAATSALVVSRARTRYNALASAGLDPSGAPAPPHPHELNVAAETAWRATNAAEGARHAGPATTAEGERGARIAEAVDAAAPEHSGAEVTDTDNPAPASTAEIPQPHSEIEP